MFYNTHSGRQQVKRGMEKESTFQVFLPKGEQKFPFTGKNSSFSNRGKFAVNFS